MNARTWSPYQQAIFAFAENGQGNAIIEAVAGSGKTTTIVELVKRVHGNVLFLAFNRSIADELKARGVNARTFHSLTYSVVLRHKGARDVSKSKLWDLVNETLNDRDAKRYGAFIVKLVGLARQQGIGCLVEDTEQAWVEIADHHDLELDSEEAEFAVGIQHARDLLATSYADRRVDFDDLLYLAVRDGLTLPKFDWVLVDEAQDTNAIQRAILRKVAHAGSRIVAVGDPAQAIYGFRGADSDSLDLIASEFNATRLPLTVSYRCPQNVVRAAQQWVSHIEAAPSAPEGKVEHLNKWDASTFQPHDLIVCRTTKPVISAAYKLLKARVPAYVLGREIGDGLKSLVKKLNAKGVEALIEKLNVWTAREVQKAVAKKQDAKVEAIQDKSDTILFLIDSLNETDRTVPGLLALIDSLFADKSNAVKLSTIHKAKGLEAERVFWLNSSQCPSKWARQDWQKQQERNLCYVAVTRAKAELYFIEDVRQGE